MRVYLINPDNPVVSLTKISRINRLNKVRVWKPLSLMTLARLTPDDWQVEIIDENLGPVNHDALALPDLVGITAFTSQATRAYQVAEIYRRRGVPVVMGGIHATMCREEALEHVDAVVSGEAEEQWPILLDDVRRGELKRHYEGGLVPIESIPPARHDLLAGRYAFGSVQTTRGCPLRCNFCSVTAFNGGKFRHRPIEKVLEDLRQIRERRILFVDDNLIGTRSDHIAYSKELFRAMIREKLTTPWICQATINFADDDELLSLASRAGCFGVFIGFESPTEEGLIEVHKKFNIQKGRDFRASVRRIQRHRIQVVGSFIMGLDTDRPGIHEKVVKACEEYGVDFANVLILTPLPGTVLWKQMEADGRILANDFPADWKYYTLNHPVAQYANLSWEQLVEEVCAFHDRFYRLPAVFYRALRRAVLSRGAPWDVLVNLIVNLSYRYNHLSNRKVYASRKAPPAPLPLARAAGVQDGAA